MIVPPRTILPAVKLIAVVAAPPPFDNVPAVLVNVPVPALMVIPPGAVAAPKFVIPTPDSVMLLEPPVSSVPAFKVIKPPAVTDNELLKEIAGNDTPALANWIIRLSPDPPVIPVPPPMVWVPPPLPLIEIVLEVPPKVIGLFTVILFPEKVNAPPLLMPVPFNVIVLVSANVPLLKFKSKTAPELTVAALPPLPVPPNPPVLAILNVPLFTRVGPV